VSEATRRSARLRVVSGGQSGVDRAALDAARALGLPRGGWCPRGRWAEDGAIPAAYPLDEIPQSEGLRVAAGDEAREAGHRDAELAQRTEWNVRDSDATLVIVGQRPLSGGSLLTAELAQSYRRPLRVVELARDPDPAKLRAWLAEHRVRTLNVGGPRASEAPDLGAGARAFLERALRPEG